MKTTKIQCRTGLEDASLGLEKNGLGVTGWDIFNVTHLKTGLAIGPHGFNNASAAEGFLGDIADLHPWSEVEAAFVRGAQPELLEKLQTAFKKWNAFDDSLSIEEGL